MIEVRNLSRYYGDHRAVDDVSFSIEDSQVIGFLGLNGAGKSTTLKVLAGLLSPSAGTVTIDGVRGDAARGGDEAESSDPSRPPKPMPTRGGMDDHGAMGTDKIEL